MHPAFSKNYLGGRAYRKERRFFQIHEKIYKNPGKMFRGDECEDRFVILRMIDKKPVIRPQLWRFPLKRLMELTIDRIFHLGYQG
jgi:hypothetical protein